MERFFRKTPVRQAATGSWAPGAVGGLTSGQPETAVSFGAREAVLSPRNTQALIDRLNAIKAQTDIEGWKPYTPLAKGR